MNLVESFATFMLQNIGFFAGEVLHVDVLYVEVGDFKSISGRFIDCVKSLNPSDWGTEELIVAVDTHPDCRITIAVEFDRSGVPTDCCNVDVSFGRGFVANFRMKPNTLNEKCNFEFEEIEVPPQYESDGVEF